MLLSQGFTKSIFMSLWVNLLITSPQYKAKFLDFAVKLSYITINLINLTDDA